MKSKKYQLALVWWQNLNSDPHSAFRLNSGSRSETLPQTWYYVIKISIGQNLKKLSWEMSCFLSWLIVDEKWSLSNLWCSVNGEDCGTTGVLVPGHVRAVLQLAGKTTQVQYRTVWTNGRTGTWSREGCPTAGRQNYPGTVKYCMWTNGIAGTWSREGCPTAGRQNYPGTVQNCVDQW